jgi:hypothetical protein
MTLTSATPTTQAIVNHHLERARVPALIPRPSLRRH